LIRETTENESANEGYRFGQEEETYNIVAAHGYFGRELLRYKNPRFLLLKPTSNLNSEPTMLQPFSSSSVFSRILWTFLV
jgi:hypothetical protein